MLKISKLKAGIDNKEILKGVDLAVGRGEVHVLMGPNGSGKSTLSQVIMGSSQFTVHSSRFSFNGKDLTKLTPDKRAKMGIFLGFQHPVEVPGVSVFNFLRRAKLVSAVGTRLVKTSPHADAPRAIKEFREELKKYMAELKLSDDFLRRSLNEGFSGGEKKRNEILQMMALRPKLVILDEIDSGLDIDGLRIVARAIKQFRHNETGSSLILITHYARILKYLKPDFVHVMVEGRIIKSGKMSLAQKVEEKGYEAFTIESSRLRSNNTSTMLSTSILRASEASREV